MANLIKKVARFLYLESALARRWLFLYIFIRNNKYIPNFKKPKTYNEKINYRKNNAKHELFAVCADKVAAKEWVAKQIGEEYVIPNYFVGDCIAPDKLKEIINENGDCLLKASHSSGAVYMLTKEATDAEIEKACAEVNKQLSIDYGRRSNEPWYSKIKPKVLVEKRLEPQRGESDVRDYRFFVFNNPNSVDVVLSVYFNARSNLTASYFDSELNWLPFSIKHPTIRTKIDRPQNYLAMLDLAKQLASHFTHARIDFYNVDGQIYFGEITFAHTSGLGAFSSYKYDLWFGRLWQGDPSY